MLGAAAADRPKTGQGLMWYCELPALSAPATLLRDETKHTQARLATQPLREGLSTA